MTKRFLQHLPLTYVNSFSFENIGAVFCIKMFNREHHLVIYLKNILVLNFSQSSLTPLDTNLDYVNLVEIIHEYREVNDNDLKKYSFGSLDILSKAPLLHIISLYGGDTDFVIICEDIDIEKLDG